MSALWKRTTTKTCNACRSIADCIHRLPHTHRRSATVAVRSAPRTCLCSDAPSHLFLPSPAENASGWCRRCILSPCLIYRHQRHRLGHAGPFPGKFQEKGGARRGGALAPVRQESESNAATALPTVAGKGCDAQDEFCAAKHSVVKKSLGSTCLCALAHRGRRGRLKNSEQAWSVPSFFVDASVIDHILRVYAIFACPNLGWYKCARYSQSRLAQ
jgi:hypothetical protein